MTMAHISEPGEVFDRVRDAPSVLDVLRRRVDGGYALDAFGADPQLQDLAAPLVRRVVRYTVVGAEHLPSTGPAALVANRGFGLAEPFVLATVVRDLVGRRLRVQGAPPFPLARDLAYKLGALGYHADDVRAALQAGNLVGLPLALTWWRTGAGEPPRDVMLACTGAPVVPVAIRPGGPFGLSLGPWRVIFGEPITIPKSAGPGDVLAAAELGDRVRRAVRALLDGTPTRSA